MEKYDVIVVGAGLAGLTASYKLVASGKSVLLVEKESFLGGRTSSWNDAGMMVEAGFHRHIGYYKELPKILKEVGVSLEDIVMWENTAEIKLSKKDSIILGIAPFFSPLKFLKGIFGNNKYLSFKDKLSLMKLFIIGFKDYKFNPKILDKYSIYEYAVKLKITKRVINYLVTSLSTGIFFLPIEEYSAKVFFGLFYPSLFRTYKLRIGAYQGGMSEVLAKPIADKFQKLGGTIKLNSAVASLILENDKVKGVRTNKKIYSEKVILATDIINTKKLVGGYNFDYFRNISLMPTMSAITVQIELKKPLMPLDRITFGPQFILISFTEESRSTFKESKGRLSIILADPDKYINLSDEKIFTLIVNDAKKMGLDIMKNLIDYRIIRHKDKFYKLSPNNDSKRPSPKTPIKGLFLAGDYVRQEMYATMEGAVISGINAFLEIMKAKD